MSFVSQVNKAQPNFVMRERETVAVIKINGKDYVGRAVCDEREVPYQAEYIGKTIAHARACMSAYREQRDFYMNNYKTLQRVYFDFMQRGLQLDDIYDEMCRQYGHYKHFCRVLTTAKKDLTSYINDLDKTMQALHRSRLRQEVEGKSN